MARFYDITPNDVSFLEELEDYFDSVGADYEKLAQDMMQRDDKSPMLVFFFKGLCDQEAFGTLADFLDRSRGMVVEAARQNPDISKMAVIALKLGIEVGDAECANTLGSCYEHGDFVPADRERAKTLYAMASDWGDPEATISLGRMYEEGLCGVADAAKALRSYAYAAVTGDSPEATWRMGDLFAAGKGMEADIAKAFDLWETAYRKAGADERMRARPAMRMASYYVEGDRDAEVEADPLLALKLYQEAEIGLRLEMEDGKNPESELSAVLAGQLRARDAAAKNPGPKPGAAREMFARAADPYADPRNPGGYPGYPGRGGEFGDFGGFGDDAF